MIFESGCCQNSLFIIIKRISKKVHTYKVAMLRAHFPTTAQISLWVSKTVKFIYTEKATKFCEISTVHRFDCQSIEQIYSGDFTKICGLLRIYELYIRQCIERDVKLPFLEQQRSCCVIYILWQGAENQPGNPYRMKYKLSRTGASTPVALYLCDL